MKRIQRLCIMLSATILLSACGNDSGVQEGAGNGNPASFNSMLMPTFQSARCQNCHGFDADNATAQNHSQQGRSEDCSTCHVVPGWKAPFKSFSFSGLSGNAICVAIKNKFGGDLEALRSSLIDSELAKWAIVDGSVPLGNPSLPTAFPGNLASWNATVNSWIEMGANCE